MAISNPVYEDDDSVEEQIRAAAAGRSANKAAPTIEADEEAPAPVPEKTTAKMPMRPGQASSGTKTPIVTKEQLGGMTLREYLNKQQGLKPRGESTRMPTRPGQEAPTYSNEGQNKPRPRGQGTVMDQGRDVDMYGGTIDDIKNMFKGTRRGGDSGKIAARMGVNPNTLLPSRMAKGGSVSSASKRADGIAQRGKTKGKMC
jgi:hypothetical protein